MFRSVLATLFVAALPFSASAAVLEYTYSAEYLVSVVRQGFDETGDFDANRVQGLGNITGTITFDDTLTYDSGDSLGFGPVAITIDSFVPHGFIMPITATIMNDDATLDSILTGNAGFPPSLPAGEHTLFGLFLVDDNNTLFSGGLAFPDLLELSDFTRARITVRSTIYDPLSTSPLDWPSKEVGFNITALDAVIDPPVVPLPAGLPLLIGGLLSLGWTARRRRA